jgi:antitoxin component YwqK of YwqJK toxin-antitoxin module
MFLIKKYLFILLLLHYFVLHSQKNETQVQTEDGILTYVYEIDDSLRNSDYSCFTDNGFLIKKRVILDDLNYELYFFDSLSENIGVETYTNDVLISKGFRYNNMDIGTWTYYDNTGAFDYSKTFLWGLYETFYPNGQRKETGYHIEDNREGNITIYDSLGARVLVKYYYNDTLLYSINFKNNLIIGASDSQDKMRNYLNELEVFKNYYPDGAINEFGHVKSKKFEGIYFKYYDRQKNFRSGITECALIGMYRNGLKQGDFIFFNKNQTIIRVEKYHLGKPISNWEIFDDYGNLLEVIEFENGEVNE